MPHENGQLTAEEIEPTEQQLQHGRELVAAGWQSVSNKYRCIRRWTTKHLTIEELIRPELVNTPEARHLMKRPRVDDISLRDAEHSGLPFEEETLTVREYRAFRLAGGQSSWP